MTIKLHFDDDARDHRHPLNSPTASPPAPPQKPPPAPASRAGPRPYRTVARRAKSVPGSSTNMGATLFGFASAGRARNTTSFNSCRMSMRLPKVWPTFTKDGSGSRNSISQPLPIFPATDVWRSSCVSKSSLSKSLASAEIPGTQFSCEKLCTFSAAHHSAVSEPRPQVAIYSGTEPSDSGQLFLFQRPQHRRIVQRPLIESEFKQERLHLRGRSGQHWMTILHKTRQRLRLFANPL